jgi:hypothetical protein
MCKKIMATMDGAGSGEILFLSQKKDSPVGHKHVTQNRPNPPGLPQKIKKT